jgi:outer membrane protein OmpA-like peptidoglycan-associated protein
MEKDNLLLSTNRAKSVVGYLLSKSINALRLTYKGFGSTNPLSENKTETEKALNRRTALSVISN